MTKTKLISTLICAALLTQGTAALTAAAAAPHFADRLHETSARADVSHESKKTLLVSRELISGELAADETKAVTYGNAADSCVVMMTRSSEPLNSMSEKDKIDFLISCGLFEETKADIDLTAQISAGEFAGLCVTATGYNVLEQAEEDTIKKSLTGSLKEDDKLTVEGFIDIMHTAINLPLCVVDSFEYNAETNTQIPHTVILDGGWYTDDDGKKQERDYATILTEIEENKDMTTEVKEEPVKAEKLDLTNAEKIDELQRLNIIARVEDLRLNDNITRAEISKILAVMLGEGETIQSAEEVSFTDVQPEHWAFNYIETLYKMGIIDGMGDGSFMPNENITYTQMCKLLVCAVGYNTYAEAIGGYPRGYIMEASALGITNGVSGEQGEELTREKTMLMAYNTLDVPLCVIDSYELDEAAKTYVPKLVITDGSGEYELYTIRIRLEDND